MINSAVVTLVYKGCLRKARGLHCKIFLEGLLAFFWAVLMGVCKGLEGERRGMVPEIFKGGRFFLVGNEGGFLAECWL